MTCCWSWLGWCVCLYLVALLPLAVPVGVWKVYVTASLFHNSFDVIPSFPNNMRVFSV